MEDLIIGQTKSGAASGAPKAAAAANAGGVLPNRSPGASGGMIVEGNQKTFMAEVIEACRLFDLPPSQVKVIVHPQSTIHSMVEFVDGSLIAQLSTPDMCLPIQYALTYPDRAVSERVQTNFPKIGTLTFEEPDVERFPAIELARRAGEVGGTLPAVLNAANEIAVEAFVNRKINFPQITELVRRTMDAHKVVSHPTLEQILVADNWARRAAAV